MVITVLLILHAIIGAALLGAVTHQLVSVLRGRPARTMAFVDRYAGANSRVFVGAVIVLFVAQVLVGAIIYPTYRLNVRIPFEEMFMYKEVGSFEMKEHFAGICMGLLPFYYWLWRPQNMDSHRRDRIAITALLTFVVWFDFIVGHFLNNLRGLSS